MKADPTEGYVREPKVGPEDLGDSDATVVTIQRYEQFKKKDGQGMVRKLVFEELPGKVHFLNLTQFKYLIEALGDETDRWIGQVIPLEIHHGQDLQGKPVTNLWVSAPEGWNEIFRQAGLAEMPNLRPRVTRGTVTTAGQQTTRKPAPKPAAKVKVKKAVGRGVKRR